MKKYFDTIVRIGISIIIFAFLCFVWPKHIMLFIAFAAVLVALFKEDIYSYYFPPRLNITLSTEPQHFHEVDARNLRTREFVEKQFWLGAIIENVGVRAAKNVEVFFSGIESNIVNGFGNYKTIPLVRSWSINRETTIRLLPPEVGVRFDICYLSSKTPNVIIFSLYTTPNEISVIQCNNNSTFTFEIKALADNAALISKKFQVKFSGQYSKDFEVKNV